MFTLANNILLHYQIEGAPQGHPLVFINSLGCDLRIWDEVVPAFTGRYRVVRYDKRGDGLSDAPPGPYAIRDHTGDLDSLLTRAGIFDCVLIGISVGGLIAMDYALLHPGRVLALVLCDTAPKISSYESWEERIHMVRARGMAEVAETIVNRWFLPTFKEIQPEVYRGYLNMLARAPAEGYTATCAALRDADLRGEIQGITAPALAVCGSGDQVVTPEQTRSWSSQLRAARSVVIDGAAHLPCIEQPRALANAIDRFLQEVIHDR